MLYINNNIESFMVLFFFFYLFNFYLYVNIYLVFERQIGRSSNLMKVT